jgi:hypothetical protein
MGSEDAVFALDQYGSLWASSHYGDALGRGEATDEEELPPGATRDLFRIDIVLDFERDEILPLLRFKGLAAADNVLAAVSSTGQLFACGECLHWTFETGGGRNG